MDVSMIPVLFMLRIIQMNEIPHIVTDKDIASMLLDLSNIISVLIGGAIGFIAKYLLEFKKMKEDKKAIRQQMITNNIAPMRQAWINDLRRAAVEFSAASEKTYFYFKNYQYEQLIPFRDEKELFNLLYSTIENLRKEYFKLDLLLPSTNEFRAESLADEIRICMKYIVDYFDTGNNYSALNEEQFDERIEVLNNKIKKLLKTEWEVTKSLKEIE